MISGLINVWFDCITSYIYSKYNIQTVESQLIRQWMLQVKNSVSSYMKTEPPYSLFRSFYGKSPQINKTSKQKYPRMIETRGQNDMFQFHKLTLQTQQRKAKPNYEKWQIICTNINIKPVALTVAMLSRSRSCSLKLKIISGGWSTLHFYSK